MGSMSELARWFYTHGHDLLETSGILGGLIFTAMSFRQDADSRKISTLIALTGQHREIWEALYRQPSLSRILQVSVPEPVEPTQAEAVFINSIIQQAHCVFQATKLGEIVGIDGVEDDLAEFFSLPLPSAVWQKSKGYFDRDFAAFVDQGIARRAKMRR